SRRAIPGRPGDLNLSRNARSDRRLPAIATFLPVVLRRPVDSAQYTSLAFGGRCREAGVRPSMGSVGDAYDNAMCESFFATLECERGTLPVHIAGRGQDGDLQLHRGVVQSRPSPFWHPLSIPNRLRDTDAQGGANDLSDKPSTKPGQLQSGR